MARVDVPARWPRRYVRGSLSRTFSRQGLDDASGRSARKPRHDPAAARQGRSPPRVSETDRPRPCGGQSADPEARQLLQRTLGGFLAARCEALDAIADETQGRVESGGSKPGARRSAAVMKRIVWVFPALVLLAGCVPGILPAQKEIAGNTLGLGAEPAPAIPNGWWTGLGDPELDRLMAAALADNPGLGEAIARLRAAKAGMEQANSALYPHADFNAQDEYTHFS